MTLGKYLFTTLIAQVLFILTKLVFIQYLNIESTTFVVLFWLCLAVISIAIVRRIGILNYFESFFLAFTWTLVALFLDLMITTTITGRAVYSTGYFWLSYAVVAIAIVIFHKKAHVEIRKMMRTQK